MKKVVKSKLQRVDNIFKDKNQSGLFILIFPSCREPYSALHFNCTKIQSYAYLFRCDNSRAESARNFVVRWSNEIESNVLVTQDYSTHSFSFVESTVGEFPNK